jgi:sugar phosphate isomerase/epimerase
MQILASKFIYPKDKENLKEVLLPFKDFAIQLAFFQKRDFLKLDHYQIKEICDSLNIEIPTVHFPTTDVFDEEFLEVIGLIKRVYKVKIVSIHPQKGDSDSALAKLEEYSSIIKDLDLILAYENFPTNAGKRKWIYLPQDMYLKFNLPFLKLTFDTSHLDFPSNCIKEFDRVFDKVAVVHLSDKDSKRQHLPLGEGFLPYEEFLEYLKVKNFKGFIVLEYLEEFQTRLFRDLERVSELLLK